MKKTFLFVIICFIASITYAQNPLPKGKSQFNGGFGFSSWGLPIYLGFDHGVHKDISLGAEFTYRSYHDDWKGVNYSHSITGFAGNFNYHFNRILKIPSVWDFYAGFNVGFFIWNSPHDYYYGYDNPHTSGLGMGLQVGGRYYFNEKLGINLEYGGGNAFSGGKIGLSVKL